MSDKPDSKILIVDDEKYLQELWQEIFSHIGYEVTTADSGRAGIEALQKTPMDIVITDIRMPETDGFVLLEYIRSAQLGQMKTFVCSGFLGDQLNFSNYQIERIISKPFDVIKEIDYFSKLLTQ